MYKAQIMHGFIKLFFVAVNTTFFPIHFIGLQGCPRKYKQLAGRYRHLVKIRRFGAVIGAMSINLFMTLFCNTMNRYRLISVYNTISGSLEGKM